MSTHTAEVVRISKIENHPDPETINLGITKVYDYQVVINKNQWREGDLAIYISMDSVVPLDHPSFAFLQKEGSTKTRERIRSKRLRGVWSEGLLIPTLEGFNEGDNAWEALRLERYEPGTKEIGTSAQWEAEPIEAKLPFGKYELEDFKRHHHLFQDGESVMISEKIHGTNSKFFWREGEQRMYCGSRSGWRRKPDDGDKKNFWWEALEQNPWIVDFCKWHNAILFGEVFGQVQNLKYGTKQGQLLFRAFDVFDLKERRFVNGCDLFTFLRDDFGEHTMAPVLYVGPYSKEKVLECTDGQSVIPGANHIREGCVVKPTTERLEPRFGRVIAKSVSNFYLLKDY